MVYNKEVLEEIVKESFSYAEVLRKLGKPHVGGNIGTIKKKINEFGIDISHFTGQRWNKGLKFTDENSVIKLKDILKEDVNYSTDRLRKRLIAEGLKEDKCDVCGITEWNGKPISLELHHVNGDRRDNRLENLQILCPNCHSQTETFKKKNKRPEDISTKLGTVLGYSECEYCHKLFKVDKQGRRFCSRECYDKAILEVGSLNKNITNTNTLVNLTEENLKNAVNKYKTIADIAREFGVSRPTIRKNLSKYNLLEKFKDKKSVD